MQHASLGDQIFLYTSSQQLQTRWLHLHMDAPSKSFAWVALILYWTKGGRKSIHPLTCCLAVDVLWRRRQMLSKILHLQINTKQCQQITVATAKLPDWHRKCVRIAVSRSWHNMLIFSTDLHTLALIFTHIMLNNAERQINPGHTDSHAEKYPVCEQKWLPSSLPLFIFN